MTDTDTESDRDASRYDEPTPGTERYWEELSDAESESEAGADDDDETDRDLASDGEADDA